MKDTILQVEHQIQNLTLISTIANYQSLIAHIFLNIKIRNINSKSIPFQLNLKEYNLV